MSNMLHKRRKRTRRIVVLQKKEELLDLKSCHNEEITNTIGSSIRNKQYESTRMKSPGQVRRTLTSWTNSRLRNSINLIFLGLFLSIFSYTNVQGQPPPLPPAGFLDFDNLPVTRFSCEGKVIGGYYADVETGCQMFHVCTLGQKDEVQDIKFLCLNGTVFDQETRVCERVDEVDCSKAEQFYDLNLDLYVPHTPKPPEPEQDQEEEDDFIRPVSTLKPTQSPTTTMKTTTTTTRPTITSTRPTTTTPRPRQTSSSSPGGSSGAKNPAPTKGYSSFNYYLKTPHSHVASGYNSQSRQSYIFNHNPTGDEAENNNGGSYTVSENENTGRKIPSGPKTIVYTPSSSTTRPSRLPSRNVIMSSTSTTTTTTTTQSPPKQEEFDEQYADEYYDDELPSDYEISSSTSGSQQTNSKQANSYELQQQSKNNQNSYQAQPQTQYRGKTNQNSYDFRDGRSTGLSKSANGSPSGGSSRGSKGGSESESVSIAVSSSKSTSSPPVISRPQIRKQQINNVTTTTTTTEEPYYYDDDYPEDEIVSQQQPAIIVRGTSSSTSRSAASKNENNNKSTSKRNEENSLRDTDPTGPSGLGDNAEYYDDGSDTPVNVNDHHFTFVDVPRIPFAKPNVPRVLVTNGKPFLPRLRRQSIHHLQQQQYPSMQQQEVIPTVDISSFWENLGYHNTNNNMHYFNRRKKRNSIFKNSSSNSKASKENKIKKNVHVDSVIRSFRKMHHLTEGTKR